MGAAWRPGGSGARDLSGRPGRPLTCRRHRYSGTVGKPVDFDTPPVVEVLIGVAFQPIEGLGSYRSGSLLDRWQQDRPRVSEQPELPPVHDLGGGPAAFVRLGPPSSTRLWFEFEDGFLIQLQSDRLVVNWRAGEGRSYCRYPAVRERFTSAWQDLVDTLGKTPHVTQVEVTYVNVATHSADEVFKGWSATPLLQQTIGQHLVNSDTPVALDGTRRAARRTTVQTNTGQPSETRLTLSIFAEVSDTAQLMEPVDAARWHIVERFRDVTTAKMHEEWGCRNNDHAYR